VITYQEITSVDLEISTLCNSSCPDCPRNLRGYDFEDPPYVLHSLTLQEVKDLLPAKFVEQLKVFKIIGNYGDFITCRDGLQIIQYLYDCNSTMPIHVSTNASGQPNIWEKLALIPTLTVKFRIDGLADTHSIYRQYTDYDLIMKNAAKYISAGGKANWEMIKFDFNSHQIDQARELSKQLGFKDFILHDQGRNKMPVFTREGNFVRNIGRPEHNHTIQELIHARHSATVNHVEFQQQHKKNTVPKNINCMAKKNKSIYISVDGRVYPCCWTGFFPELDLVRPGNDQIKDLSVGNNAFEVGIENAIDWFNQLEKTWTIATVSQGRSLICNETCGRTAIDG